MKSAGKAACILPHGVLFRGNAEAVIRQQLVRSGYLKGIIGLPANLFYGTGIPPRRCMRGRGTSILSGWSARIVGECTGDLSTSEKR
jgi:hypothetical protein